MELFERIELVSKVGSDDKTNAAKYKLIIDGEFLEEHSILDLSIDTVKGFDGSSEKVEKNKTKLGRGIYSAVLFSEDIFESYKSGKEINRIQILIIFILLWRMKLSKRVLI